MVEIDGLYTLFTIALVIVVLQLIVIVVMMRQIKNLREQVESFTQSVGTSDSDGDTVPQDAVDVDNGTTDSQDIDETSDGNDTTIPEQADEGTPEAQSRSKTIKEKVIDTILKIKEIAPEDLSLVTKDLSAYFAESPHEKYTEDLNSREYFRLVDLSGQDDTRVVVIGDIHCDYHSLVAILLKLSVSDYDYFAKAVFVFLGDYLDRGTVLFEPLLLLKGLKELLGDRMIMLKGNHESIHYSDKTRMISTSVIPNQSCECLNRYCGNDSPFLRLFASHYSNLPIYVYLKTAGRNVILTHAAIPRDKNMDSFYLDETTGDIVFEFNTPISDRLKIRNSIFKDMIWGDPRNCEEKMQCESRFEFGRKQFERFASRNHIDLLLRSHEEASRGYKSFFEEKLFTLFSTGGAENSQTGYPNVEPAFAIMKNGHLMIENSYIYTIQDGSKLRVVNLFNKQQYTEIQQEGMKLNAEFQCSKETGDYIREIIKTVKASFPSD